MLALAEHLVNVTEFASVFGKLKRSIQKGRNKNNASHRENNNKKKLLKKLKRYQSGLHNH